MSWVIAVQRLQQPDGGDLLEVLERNPLAAIKAPRNRVSKRQVIDGSGVRGPAVRGGQRRRGGLLLHARGDSWRLRAPSRPGRLVTRHPSTPRFHDRRVRIRRFGIDGSTGAANGSIWSSPEARDSSGGVSASRIARSPPAHAQPPRGAHAVRRGPLRVPRLLREGARPAPLAGAPGHPGRGCHAAERPPPSAAAEARVRRCERTACLSQWFRIAGTTVHCAECLIRRPPPVRARRHVDPSSPACPGIAEHFALRATAPADPVRRRRFGTAQGRRGRRSGEDPRRHVPNRAAACRRATCSGSSRR